MTANQYFLGKERVRPFLFLALMLLVYALLELGLFRSGVYQSVMSPESVAGKLNYMVDFEKFRPPSGKKEVLLTGDSVMEYAFWTGLFEKENPGTPVKFIMGSVPGSPLSWWYYLLQEIDPRHDRYAAIVIPVHGYKIYPQPLDEANRYETAQVLAPVLSPAAYADLLATFGDPDTRYRAALLGAFINHDFSLDLQDLIAHPLHRIAAVRKRYTIGPNWGHDNPGMKATMEELHIGADGGVDRYPAGFGSLGRKATADQFIRPAPATARYLTAREEHFYRLWIGRIADAYRNSPTKLIFVPDPRWPVPLPAREALPDAPDLRDLTPRTGNIVWLDEAMFDDLERPAFFWDAFHLNRWGRKIYTERLGPRVAAMVAQ